MLMYRTSDMKNFKAFYTKYLPHYKNDFGPLPCYDHFVTLMKRAMPYLLGLLQILCNNAQEDEAYYTDSTKIPVCAMTRKNSHKVFADSAALGKTGAGWFYGFKLHIVINTYGEIAGLTLTPGNVDDRSVVNITTSGLTGSVFGDKGYISKDLSEELYLRGLQLITYIRKNMKNVLLKIKDKILLKGRTLVESVFNVLKNNLDIAHTRHRSPVNGFVHIITTLVSYGMRPNKPTLRQVRKRAECWDYVTV
jgi:hypothetical protein